MKRLYTSISELEQAEHNLQKEQDFIRAIFETVDALMLVLDLDGGIILFNRACERTTGYTFEEVKGKRVWDLFLIPEEIERVKAVFEENNAGSLQDKVENYWLTRDGKRRLISWSNTVFRDRQGNVECIIATGVDITERREAEQAVQKTNEELVASSEELVASNEELIASNEELKAVEEELRQQVIELQQSREQMALLNQRLQDIIEFLPDATFVIDENKRVIAWNKATEELTGVPKEDMLGKGDHAYAIPFYGKLRRILIDLIFADDDNKIKEQYLNYSKKGNTLFGEAFVPNVLGGNGAFVWLKASPLCDGKGNITGAIQSIRNITDRKRAEEAVQTERERLFAILDGLQAYVYLQGMDHTISFANRYFIKQFGKPGGGKCYSVIHGFDKPCEPCPTFSVFSKMEPMEWEWVRLGSNVYQVYDYPFIDVDGTPMVLEMGVDVTERKRVEEALYKEKERLAVTLRSIGEGVITTDTDGKVVLINRAAEKLTGWSQQEAMGKSLTEIYLVFDDKKHQRRESPVERVLRDRDVVSFASHNILVARSGTERIISHSAAPIFDQNNQITGVVIVFSDITSLIKMEQEALKANKLESVSILAGGIAHDFNNILTAIVGNISLAKMYASEDAELQQVLDEVNKASLRARELTQQLLTFAIGGVPVKKTASVGELILDTSSFALRGTNVKSQHSIPDDLWTVDIDRGQISQVINNLVINAYQAMPGGGTIRLSCENVIIDAGYNLPLPDGKYIKIAVEDSGIGIPREFQPKIFDPYFTTKQKGSGLGLAISYSIIKKHGGHISVESKLGTGTIFYIYLPASQHQIEPDDDKQQAFCGYGRILVMDDEDMVREVAGRMLKHMGYEVESASDGVQAVDMYKKAMAAGRPFDVVIMDLTIPGGMGGKETIIKLQEIDPQVKSIVSSGYSNDPVMGDFRHYGFKGVVVKPFNVEELSATLHYVMENGEG